LIQPLLRSRAVALGVNVKSVSSAGRLSIHQYAESYGSASSCRAMTRCSAGEWISGGSFERWK
jgi:hypothetical protein